MDYSWIILIERYSSAALFYWTHGAYSSNANHRGRLGPCSHNEEQRSDCHEQEHLVINGDVEGVEGGPAASMRMLIGGASQVLEPSISIAVSMSKMLRPLNIRNSNGNSNWPSDCFRNDCLGQVQGLRQ